MANFAAVLMEPMSMRSWAGKDVSNNEVRLNKETPFYRYMTPAKIAGTEAVDILTPDFTDVFVFNIHPFSVAELKRVRALCGRSDLQVEAVCVYGEKPAGEVRAYLPSDHNERDWYLLDGGTLTRKEVLADSAMNRSYITIPAGGFTEDGTGYYRFNLAFTPKSGNAGNASSGSGCNAAFASAALCAPAALALSAMRKEQTKRP